MKTMLAAVLPSTTTEGHRDPWIDELTPDTWLDRQRLAQALTAHGFPIAPATLQRKAAIRRGPPYRSFGRRVSYRWGTALEWAQREARDVDPDAKSTTSKD
jgi:hypothetical protein